MPVIHSLNIQNYRGIKNFSHNFANSKFICLMGRGDSGKTTILDAICNVLSPSWSITFHDNDFYNCDTSSPILIEATIKDLPQAFIKDDRFGLYIRGIDESNTVFDELEEHHEKALTIRLEVKKDLEPKWFVVNNRNLEPSPISAHDRAKLNVFMISDYLDRHFSWTKGNPLYSLLKQENTEEDNGVDDVFIDAFRIAKQKIDEHTFVKFEKVTSKVKDNASSLGVDISSVSTAIDFKDISIKDGRVCLHEENIPFRLKGKGSKRLISVAIQTALSSEGGIVLIDEIEQGLEPDRVQHLVGTLKRTNRGQIFLTTHSRDVIVELQTEDLYLLSKGKSALLEFDESMQGCLRKNPEAFFAKKVIICEGSTEIGICKALNTYRVKQHNYNNASWLGVKFADGSGRQLVDYAKGFKKMNFDVCIFCDSDGKKKNSIEKEKEELRESGIKIIDWSTGDCLEVAILKDVPPETIEQILNLAAQLKLETSPRTVEEIKKSLWQSVSDKYGPNCPQKLPNENCNEQLRLAIGQAASNGDWFKSQTKGELLGRLVLDCFKKLENNKLKSQLNELSKWMDGNEL